MHWPQKLGRSSTDSSVWMALRGLRWQRRLLIVSLVISFGMLACWKAVVSTAGGRHAGAAQGAEGVVHVREFRVPARLLPATQNTPMRDVTIAADVFLVGGCVKFLSVLTCQYPSINFSVVEATIHSTWTGPADCDRIDECMPGVRKTGVGVTVPATRILHRDASNWEPTTVGEFCIGDLTSALAADVTLRFGNFSQFYHLDRISTRQHASEFAMMSMYRNDSWTTPAWLDVWGAMGIGHFYLYYNGDLTSMRAENPSLIAELEADPRVTMHTWDFPMRSVIVDRTGKSTLPVVNHYGKIWCYLHYAKMMAFNDAYIRYGGRHAWMGFFDFDEYLGIDSRFLTEAAALHVSPLRLLASTYMNAGVDVFTLANRWTFIQPGVELGAPMRSEHVLSRKLLGGTIEPFGKFARSKYFVRAAGGMGEAGARWSAGGRRRRGSDAAGGGGAAAAPGVVALRQRVQQQQQRKAAAVVQRSPSPFPSPLPPRPPYMLGNHYVCKLSVLSILASGTSQWSGACERPDEPVALSIPPRDAYSVHLLNLKPHVSLIELDEEGMLNTAYRNNAFIEDVHFALQHAHEFGGGGDE